MNSNPWTQKEFSLPSLSRGCHLITDKIVEGIPEIKNYQIGILHLFLQHTSASLSLNENWDPDVRKDFEESINKIAPEGKHYRHSCEGPDDMPAHIKSSLIGVIFSLNKASISIPITNGKLNLGTWQGIWLCEHRDGKRSRNLVATINGMPK